MEKEKEKEKDILDVCMYFTKVSRLFASVTFGRAVAVPSQADSCTNVCVLVFFLLCVFASCVRGKAVLRHIVQVSHVHPFPARFIPSVSV